MSPHTVYFFHIPCTHFVSILLPHVSYLVVRQVFSLEISHNSVDIKEQEVQRCDIPLHFLFLSIKHYSARYFSRQLLSYSMAFSLKSA